MDVNLVLIFVIYIKIVILIYVGRLFFIKVFLIFILLVMDDVLN